MTHTCLESIHNDLVKSVKFISSNQTIISSSDDPLKSIAISDPSKTKKPYNFSHSKVTLLLSA